MTPSIREHIQHILPALTTLRHELHAHPEIRFEEVWTSDRIAAFLEEAGVPFSRGYAKGTGIVAVLEGEGPRTVALRADMDALELQEETGVPYASKIPGRMHACGHDGHMSCLCGAVHALAAQREDLRGTVKFIFQPAEEQAAGGRFIVEEGVLDGVDAAFALHAWPQYAAGTAGAGTGSVMAAADFFRIEIRGLGGHGADPATAVDPIVTAAHIITALQTIASRETNPWDATVVSVARVEAGTTSNIIPDTAWMEGTFRSLTEPVRQRMRAAIERIAGDVARAFRATAQVSFGKNPYPPTVNDPEMSVFARDTIQDILGQGSLVPVTHPYMTAEDFSFYLERVPGAFIFLGNSDQQGGEVPPLHSPRFNFNDAALPFGAEILATLALRFLNREL